MCWFLLDAMFFCNNFAGWLQKDSSNMRCWFLLDAMIFCDKLARWLQNSILCVVSIVCFSWAHLSRCLERLLAACWVIVQRTLSIIKTAHNIAMLLLSSCFCTQTAREIPFKAIRFAPSSHLVNLLQNMASTTAAGIYWSTNTECNAPMSRNYLTIAHNPFLNIWDRALDEDFGRLVRPLLKNHL